MLISIAILITCLLLFLITLFVTGRVMFDYLSTWLGRIKIGRWDSREQWRNAVEAKARKYLHGKLPTKASSFQSWQVGGLLLGLDDSDAERYASAHPDLFLKGASDVETAFLAFALKQRGKLPQKKEEELRGRLSNKSSQGTLPYRDSDSDPRYVDTIGLACPFLYSTGLSEIADKQIIEYDKILHGGVFPPHAFDTARNLPMGVYDWSRGTGWYILGIISSRSNEGRVLKLAERMLEFQRNDGSFGSFIFNPSSRKESTGTILAGILFVTAYKWSGDERFLSSAKMAEKALMIMTRRDGSVDFAQGDTIGIGLYSTHFGTMPFAQGMALYLSKSIDALTV